ncbi:DUF4139 domain-containing protein [Marinagarivorans cellulosilyticus]|uniref:DUF4139 domain-containing protein n=1 Tax=Marinagarivorans cellulosilyticus TaxID=2721545 RepID=A0AAN1WGH9_9GAMM|nr:DUF4139 domain-containing protein [Marinagarivorans cellulosilyticus]BCD97178.1 hypothetical protein MARGE09_P1379 [Marinagarivorans cellulosilyticus]
MPLRCRTHDKFASLLKPATLASSLVFFTSSLYFPTAIADTVVSTLEDQSGLAITIYNSNLALIKDQRQVTIPKGEHDVEFIGVSGQIKPQTALLRSTTNANTLKVLEQNFDYDLLTPQKLLEKYQGKTIQLQRIDNSTNTALPLQNAKVLSTNNGVIVEVDGKIETNPSGHFIFPALPNNLRAQPTLTTTVKNTRRGKDTYELSYLTNGLSWHADYVAQLKEDNSLDLASWVTLSNNSNTQYRNAKIQLVAGEINQVHEHPKRMDMMMAKSSMIMAESPSTEDLMEFKLYSLPRQTNLANAQTKQVSLFTAANVTSQQQLVFSASPINRYNITSEETQKLKPTVQLLLKNDKKSNLGIALPKGIVRVYQQDSQGNAQFVGEDSLDHTAENEDIVLTLGKSFDVSAERKLLDYKIINDNNKNFEFESSYQITFNNAKNTSATVKMVEHLDGQWTIKQSSSPYTKESANSAAWNITLAPKSKSTLTFTVAVKSR